MNLPLLCLCAASLQMATLAADLEVLPNTAPLTLPGDLASNLVAGVDRFLLRELADSPARRDQYWRRTFASPSDQQTWISTNRARFEHMIGARDQRPAAGALEFISSTTHPAKIAAGPTYDILAIRWPAFSDVHGEGLLLAPHGRPSANVIAVPDADQTPELIAGLAEGLPPASQFARRLAEAGCRVLVPALIDRRLEARQGKARLSTREFLYRPAFELGRHLIGYEVQKVRALADWCKHEDERTGSALPLGLIGWGEGGLLALYTSAIDTRFHATLVSGYFNERQNVWEEPIDRNVFSLLERFGDAELACLILPRSLAIEAARGPDITLPSQGGAPARLTTPALAAVEREVRRAQQLADHLHLNAAPELIVSGNGAGPFGSEPALQSFLARLAPHATLLPSATPPAPAAARSPARAERLAREIDQHNQALLAESAYVRREFMKRLDSSSTEAHLRTVRAYRDFFAQEVIGRFEHPLLPPDPRSRLAYSTNRWTGYEVVLDVFPDVIAYGILLLPRDLQPGEKRPVVVCQHGLEGRPQDVIEQNKAFGYYKGFAAQLADRGFITFAPQNLYIFGDRFRTLQRKANPLQKSLFSIITPQHEQIIRWLKSLPQVDPERIAFYGLSYGGKTAMRVPALLPDYCLSICSADFNEWVWKNASSRSPYSYVWTGEYEIFEFDLGSTFNYAEMAALIAPRPFMVERGHFDGVAPDEAVAYEFAKVRSLYQAQLRLPGRCEIEWFPGPHSINGQGTFDFLHRHLNWPKPGL